MQWRWNWGTPGGWMAEAWRATWWFALYWAVFAVLGGGTGRWAYVGCQAEGLAGPCGTPALYLGVVLAALPSAAVVAVTATLVLALRRLRRAPGASALARTAVKPVGDAAPATGEAD